MKSPYLNILQTVYLIIFLTGITNFVFAQHNTVENVITSIKADNYADTLSKLQVRKVLITGNKKTKDYIILREMNIKPGDSVAIYNLPAILEKNRQRIYNTTLFVEVTVKPLIINALEIDVNITVKERWYIFPLPELKFVDGNINKWVQHYKSDMTKINYGIKFIHNNLTGRKDQLGIHLLNGYTKTIAFKYRAPFLNSALTNGFSVNGSYVKSREVAFKTGRDNEYLFYKRNHFVRNAWDIHVGYSIRKGLKTTHIFNIGYTHVNVDDSIASVNYNKDYFNNGISKIGYIDLNYTLRYIDEDNILYPLTGISGSIGISKRGLGFSGGINSFGIEGEINKYWSLGKKWYAGSQVQAHIKLPFNQSYINQHALGHGNNYIRGLEYKVIDGVAYGIAKFNLKKEIFNFSINTIFKKSKTLNKLPFRIYAKTFADMGYCYNPDFASALNNTFLGSTGVGIDIVTLYDIQIRFEYSINQLGQKGLFLHNEKGF